MMRYVQLYSMGGHLPKICISYAWITLNILVALSTWLLTDDVDRSMDSTIMLCWTGFGSTSHVKQNKLLPVMILLIPLTYSLFVLDI